MRFTHRVHVRFEGYPVFVLRYLSGQQLMIPIPSINATDGVDPFDGVQPPIQGFLQNKRINHALYITAGNHDEQ